MKKNKAKFDESENDILLCREVWRARKGFGDVNDVDENSLDSVSFPFDLDNEIRHLKDTKQK